MRKQKRNEANEPQDDADTMRKRIIRKLNDAQEYWRLCRDPSCRRARRCAGHDMRCLRDIPQPTISEAEGARRISSFRKAVQQRIAELESGQ